MQRRPTRWAVVAVTVTFCALGLSFSAQTLIPRPAGDRLQVTAPNLHFLSGKALDHLHNGASVLFSFQMTLTTIPRSIPIQRALDRFLISYDVWGERFKAVEISNPHRSATNLTANAAESWCIDQIGLSWAGAPMDKDLWIRLEIRAEDPRESPITNSGLDLTSLVDIISQLPRSGAQTWVAETAPFRLAGLRR